MCQREECNIIEMGWWINTANNYFIRNYFTSKQGLSSKVMEVGCKGVFATVLAYNDNNTEKAYKYGHFYLDFDCKEDFEKVREDALKALSYLKVVFGIEPESAYIYFSGGKGVHITIPPEYLLLEPMVDIHSLYKYIAQNISKYTTHKTVDLSIYDYKRLFRVPNTIHEKSGVYKIPITYEELRNLSYEGILELAKRPRRVAIKEYIRPSFLNGRMKDLIEQFNKNKVDENRNIKYKAKLKVTPPCIKYLLETGAKDGFRNNSIAVLASFYKNKGVDFNTAVNEIGEWNETRNSPPTSGAELKRTIRSIYSSSASYGCNTIKNVTECNEKECPLKNKKGKK